MRGDNELAPIENARCAGQDNIAHFKDYGFDPRDVINAAAGAILGESTLLTQWGIAEAILTIASAYDLRVTEEVVRECSRERVRHTKEKGMDAGDFIDEARVWARKEMQRMKVQGHGPDVSMRELERIGLPRQTGRWRKVFFALMILKIANDRAESERK